MLILRVMATKRKSTYNFVKEPNKPGSTRQACQCIIAWSECSSFPIYLSFQNFSLSLLSGNTKLALLNKRNFTLKIQKN